MAERIHLASNNADLGGGEQMLVRTAEALLALAHDVVVVAPDTTSDVLDAAASIGADVVAIRADDRAQYMRRLRTWDRTRRNGLLWCHGLVPALATAGHRGRLIHLHQLPRSRAQHASLLLARTGRSSRVVVPSAFLANRVGGAQACANWTGDVSLRSPRPPGRTVGFLGRLSTIKGLDLLARAIAAGPSDVRLLVAGDDRWVPEDEAAPVRAALAALGARVDLVGRVTPAQFFDQVDLAVFPSRVPESFGLVVAEAMAAGVPFVISDAGALPEVAGPVHPWVARAGDAEELARVIGLALAATPDQVGDATDRARQRWEREYSPAAGIERVRRLLEQLEAT